MSSNNHNYSTESEEEELLLTDKLARRAKYAERRNKMYSRKEFRKGDEIRINKYVIYTLFAVIFILLVLVIRNEVRSSNDISSTPRKPKCKQILFCQNPFQDATKGKWVEETNLTVPWVQEHVQAIRRKLHLPENMTRDDMKCGLSAPIANTRLAALCDPKSKNLYCCSETSGWCGNTNEHCAIKGGYDARSKVPLHTAKWRTNIASCNVYNFDQSHACSMLNKNVKKLIFLGDNQARHFFTALLLFLSANYKNGAIKKSNKANKYVMANCTNEYQLLNKNCRHFLVKSSREVENFCSGEYSDFHIEYHADYLTYFGKKSKKIITDLQGVENTFVVIGAGTHFNSDHNSFVNYYMRTLLSEIRKRGIGWPKFVLETLPNVYSYKSNEHRWRFNNAVVNFLQQEISLFDNQRLTENLESHDGRTYGLKFNILKVHILLHHLYNTNPKCETSKEE